MLIWPQKGDEKPTKRARRREDMTVAFLEVGQFWVKKGDFC